MQKDDSARFRIAQMTDNGTTVTLALVEDVELETVSQQQMMLEAIDRAVVDKEIKEQIRPILEAMLRAQPQTVIRSYAQTTIQLSIPRRRYEQLGSPRVGDRLSVDIRNRQ
jgi:hypothetical protein